jgi:hypothetical protein
VAAIAALATQGALARADETGSAAALFETGLQLMQASRHAEACPKLAESYWLDPRPGVLFTLAECEARWGKLASAIAHYDDYLRLFGSMPAGLQAVQRERAEIAKKQRAALAERVPTITLVLPAAAPANVIVRRDDTTLGAPSLGVALPVDPGSHVVVVQLPSGASTSRTITVAPGEKQRIELEVPVETARPASAAPASARTKSTPSAAAIALFGVGAAGVAAGAVTGGMALGQKGDIDAHCTGVVCDAEGKRTADRAKTLGWASTIGFGAGAAAIAAGAIVWLAGPKKADAARAAVQPASWGVGGATAFGVAGRF